MDVIAALPKDPLFEIFSRVDNNKDLFMFAVTCRWWLRRFTDPAFLRELCRVKGEGHHVRLLGFFQETRFERCKRTSKLRKREKTSVPLPTFFPAPGSPLGPRSLTSFFAAAAAEGTFNYAEPLASRRGIVLMNLIPRTICDAHRGFGNTSGPLVVGLFNPITGERHVLPPLYLRGANVLSRFAIITAADDNDGVERRSNTFLQLLVVSQGSQGVYLHSYCASARSWSPMTTKCYDNGHIYMVGERSGVVHQGAAHWLCMDYASKRGHARDDDLYMLSVEAETMRVALKKLPIRAGGLPPVLCVSADNKLTVACVYIVHAVVWTQQEDDNDGEEGGDDDGTPTPWLRTVIRIPAGVPAPDNFPLGQRQRGARWYHLGKGSLLLVHQSSAVFVLDLEEKVMKEVKDRLLPVPHGDNDNQGGALVPYEMGLLDFFGSRRPAFLLDDQEAQE